jgi:radical SAM protein with 4Fe4S-binding SPASM domain
MYFRCPSAKMVSKARDDLPEPESPVTTTSRSIEPRPATGLQVAVNTQINRLNRNELHAVLDEIINAGCHGWQFMLTVPAGRAADQPALLLQPADLLTLFPMLMELKARCTEKDITFLPGNNVGYFGPHEHALRGGLRSGCNVDCQAGRSTLGIEANGDIKGCPSLPTKDWVGGNVRDHALADIWQRAPQLQFTRERTTETLWGYCADCYYADSCKAGCTWTAESFMGRPGNRERLVQIEPAWGEAFDYALWEIVVEPFEEKTP